MPPVANPMATRPVPRRNPLRLGFAFIGFLPCDYDYEPRSHRPMQRAAGARGGWYAVPLETKRRKCRTASAGRLFNHRYTRSASGLKSEVLIVANECRRKVSGQKDRVRCEHIPRDIFSTAILPCAGKRAAKQVCPFRQIPRWRKSQPGLRRHECARRTRTCEWGKG